VVEIDEKTLSYSNALFFSFSFLRVSNALELAPGPEEDWTKNVFVSLRNLIAAQLTTSSAVWMGR